MNSIRAAIREKSTGNDGAAFFRRNASSRYATTSAGMPFGRAATPEEIGNAVAFLASPVSGYTSGAILTIDGGGGMVPGA